MESLRTLNKLPFSKRALPKKVIISYVLDYVIIVVLAAIFFALDAVEPYHQHFSLQNYTLQYPHAVHERVSPGLCYFIAVVCPAAVIALYTLVIDGLFSHQRPNSAVSGRRSLLGRYRLKDRLWELNCGILGLLLSEGAAFVITGTFKNAVGKPRPDLIDRCQPRAGSADPKPYGLSNSTICTQDNNAILKDGFKSFPSGHSSSSFAGLFYLSLYLAAKLHIADSKGEVWKVFVCLIPTLGAGLIATSRIMDARHHPFDVITGSLLGVLCAYTAYRQYFPAIGDTWRKGRAYPIRTWGQSAAQPPAKLVVASSGTAPAQHYSEEPSTPTIMARQHEQSDSEAHLTAAAAPPPTAAFQRQAPQVAPTNVLSSGSRRQRRDADYAYSSSEDEGSYELRPAYTLSDPQAQAVHPAYDPVRVDYGGETAYVPQTQRPGHAAGSV